MLRSSEAAFRDGVGGGTLIAVFRGHPDLKFVEFVRGEDGVRCMPYEKLLPTHETRIYRVVEHVAQIVFVPAFLYIYYRFQ